LEEDTYSLDFYFVAFLDILGFSNMVRHDCESPGRDTFIKNLFNLYKFTKKIGATSPHLDIIQFSDSVVFSMPLSKDNFIYFINVISDYQYNLFKENLLCRGGIAFGKHFSSEGFVFSDGLIEAYLLEKQSAIYPRILISRDLLNLIYVKETPSHVPLLVESDDEIFVDFLANRNLEEVSKYLNLILENNDSQNSSIKKKYHWLMEYFDYKITKSSSTVKKLAKQRFDLVKNK
jgi:hypothetical protein